MGFALSAEYLAMNVHMLALATMIAHLHEQFSSSSSVGSLFIDLISTMQ